MKNKSSLPQDNIGKGFRSLSPPVWRASTVLFDNIADFTSRKERLVDGYTYGVTGTPTTRAFEQRVAVLEGARYAVVAL